MRRLRKEKIGEREKIRGREKKANHCFFSFFCLHLHYSGRDLDYLVPMNAMNMYFFLILFTYIAGGEGIGRNTASVPVSILYSL